MPTDSSSPTDSVHIFPDGRKVGYAIFGSPSLQRPLFYFHGFPGSRLEVAFAAEVASRLGVTLIGMDRPGFGLSAHYPERKIVDWPADVVAVADALGIKKFSVFGISGGCPYALACAALVPDRVQKVAVVSGLGMLESKEVLQHMNFFNRKMLSLAVAAPFAARMIVRRLTKSLHKRPEAMIAWLSTVSPRADKLILRKPEVREILKRSFREGLRGDGDGVAHELFLIARPWGFRPDEIKIPVYLWHGLADDYVPVEMGKHLAELIPGCTATFVPDQGHFMVVSFVEEIIRKLIDSVPSAS